MEDLCDKWSELGIEEEEDGEVMFFDEEELVSSAADLSGCLLGRLLRKRSFNKSALKSVMARIWRTSWKLEISDHGEGILCFRFEKASDKDRVWDSGPWTFDKSTLVLCDPAIEKPSGDEFRYVEFWVQLHGIPFKYRSVRMGELIGGKIGKVVKVEKNREGRVCGEFIRARIAIDIGKPLMKGVFIKLGAEEGKSWVAFRFEKLGDFCFACGRLGHGESECPDKDATPSRDGKGEFGGWMRGETP